MANEQWYMLKIRPGFTAVVAQRLRNQHFEVFVPETESSDSQKASASDYVYCRFELQIRETVISVPGVLDVLGTPEPISIDPDWSAMHLDSRLRP